MDDTYLDLAKALQAHREVCLCVVVETTGSVPRPAGSKMLVYANGKTSGSVGGGGLEAEVINEALDALNTGRPKLVSYSLTDKDGENFGVCGGNATVYIEPQLGKPTLLILGAGHVGIAVAKMAGMMDYHVVLTDDREDALGDFELPENVTFIQSEIADLPEKININTQTCIIGVTRDAALDIEGFPALLNTEAAYFGAIGSRIRWQHTRNALLEAGVSEANLARIKSPIGIDIRGVTPDEIAISILAEIIQHLNTR